MSNLWETCLETGKTYKSFRGFLNNLRHLNMTSKEYYDKHHKTEDEGICAICGNQTTYRSFSYKKHCSDICSAKSPEHRKAVSERFINNPSALISFRNKIKKYHTPEIFKEKENKRKYTIKNKCLKLGISEYEYYSDHGRKTAENLSQEQIYQRTLKAQDTKEQRGIVSGRSGYKPYPFFDEFVNLQGWEPIVLDELINVYDLKKCDINVGRIKIPIIKYIENEKQRSYFPDFFLPNHNLLIEVKSKFTLEKQYSNVMLKCQASIDNGYSIILLVLNRSEAVERKLRDSKKLLDSAINTKNSKPTWYGEGSTTTSKENINLFDNYLTFEE